MNPLPQRMDFTSECPLHSERPQGAVALARLETRIRRRQRAVDVDVHAFIGNVAQFREQPELPPDDVLAGDVDVCARLLEIFGVRLNLATAEVALELPPS